MAEVPFTASAASKYSRCSSGTGLIKWVAHDTNELVLAVLPEMERGEKRVLPLAAPVRRFPVALLGSWCGGGMAGGACPRINANTGEDRIAVDSWPFRLLESSNR